MSLEADSTEKQIQDDRDLIQVESLSENGAFTQSPEELRLVRKLDRRILPITGLLCLLASAPSGQFYPCYIDWNFNLDLDRSNLGNARLQGLPNDILGGDRSGKLFDWLVSAYFFSYVRVICFPQRRFVLLHLEL